MNRSVRRPASVAAAVSCLLLAAGCGSGPVTSSVPLSKLGHDVVRNGTSLSNQAASHFHTAVHVVRPGYHDLRCGGGKQRRYAARISAAVPSADSKDLDTVLAHLATTTLDKQGYHLKGKDSSASLQLQTNPKDSGARLTVLTVVKRSGDHFTWQVRALTACIKKG